MSQDNNSNLLLNPTSYECTFPNCEKVYTSSAGLRYHYKSFHPNYDSANQQQYTNFYKEDNTLSPGSQSSSSSSSSEDFAGIRRDSQLSMESAHHEDEGITDNEYEDEILTDYQQQLLQNPVISSFANTSSFADNISVTTEDTAAHLLQFSYPVLGSTSNSNDDLVILNQQGIQPDQLIEYSKSPESNRSTKKPVKPKQPKSSGTKEYHCPIEGCLNKYQTAAGLRYHTKSIHSVTVKQAKNQEYKEKPAIFVCSVVCSQPVNMIGKKCGKKYTTMAGLRYHLKKTVH